MDRVQQLLTTNCDMYRISEQLHTYDSPKTENKNLVNRIQKASNSKPILSQKKENSLKEKPNSRLENEKVNNTD